MESAGMCLSSLEGVQSSQGTDMQSAAFFIAIFAGLFLAILLSFLPLIQSGKQWTAAEDKARVRRLADARMNARLLRLNL
jgi:hypothetical protein